MINPKYDNLEIKCNGCGGLMRPMGIWPSMNMTEVVNRYCCPFGCRIVSVGNGSNMPAVISIAEPDLVTVPGDDGEGTYVMQDRVA